MARGNRLGGRSTLHPQLSGTGLSFRNASGLAQEWPRFCARRLLQPSERATEPASVAADGGSRSYWPVPAARAAANNRCPLRGQPERQHISDAPEIGTASHAALAAESEAAGGAAAAAISASG